MAVNCRLPANGDPARDDCTVRVQPRPLAGQGCAIADSNFKITELGGPTVV
jgi:hypothetical protein